MSWAGAAFDLTIVGWLLWRRTRPAAYLVLIVFHLITWLLFPIGMFPWIMIAGTLIFFPPDWPHRVLARFISRRRTGYVPTLPSHFPTTALHRAGVVALVLIAMAQITVPLRHWFYPGDVRWNEDGYRFAWNIMLTEKTGLVRFRVADPSTGEEWMAHPEDYLSPLQVERMSYQPDMILQTAHLIAEDWKTRGRSVEIRADAFVTFNGRQAARLIGPEVDLARVVPGIQPSHWVLRAPDG